MPRLQSYLHDFSHLLFPIQCVGCKNALDVHDELLCATCESQLPLTKYWLQQEHAMDRIFWGKLPITSTAAYLYFTKDGIVQSMLHHLKYRGKKEVGLMLGERFGEALKCANRTQPEVIVPVPLHATRLRQRGYNQCDVIAEGLSRSMNIPVNTQAIARIRANKSQTKKGRYDRWINVKELFRVVNPAALEGKHVLLVDDVITTGSTLEACADVVLKVSGTRVSVATIACPSPV